MTEVVPEQVRPRQLLGTIGPTGYVLPPGLEYEQWADEGPVLIGMAQSAMWWVGDWLRYGEHTYGEKYAQAVEATGLSVQTLKNAQWVADRIPPSERNPEVPFSHHRAVASLDPKPRRDILKAAAKEHLSEYDVRERVRELKQEGSAPLPDTPPTRTVADALADALTALNDALDREDWPQVANARAFVEEARLIHDGALVV